MIVPNYSLSSKNLELSLPLVSPLDFKLWTFPACRKGMRMEGDKHPALKYLSYGIRRWRLPGEH